MWRAIFYGGNPAQVAESAELFHDRDLTAYADVMVNGHRQTFPIRGRGFKLWLLYGFYIGTEGGAPNREAVNSALDSIEATARFKGPVRDVFVRVGEHNGKLYLDLANDDYQAVEIDKEGHRVIDNPPVRFRRAPGMEALSIPEPGGSIDNLRRLINVKNEEDFVLVVSWLLAALRNVGPYAVLALLGEHGTAKSTLARLLRGLVDPNRATLRTLPRDERDLFIAASNGYVLSFDNVSGLRDWLSDALCRLATGGGFATRTLYTDLEETMIDAMRPIILNGITDIVGRPDLADRAIFLHLEPIAEDQRRTESEVWKEFDNVRPGILGALLDAIVHGLRKLPSTKLDRLPRMADFALWATACEGALWAAGTFAKAYDRNRGEATSDVIEGDIIALRIRDLQKAKWEGTAAQLLALLETEEDRNSKDWPRSPRALRSRLTRAAPMLRQIGFSGDWITRAGEDGRCPTHCTNGKSISLKRGRYGTSGDCTKYA